MIIEWLPLEVTGKIIRLLDPCDVKELLKATGSRLTHLFNLYTDVDFHEVERSSLTSFFESKEPTVHWRCVRPQRLFSLIEITRLGELDFAAFSKKFSKGVNNFIVLNGSSDVPDVLRPNGEPIPSIHQFNGPNDTVINRFLGLMLPSSIIMVHKIEKSFRLSMEAIRDTHNRLYIKDSAEINLNLSAKVRPSLFEWQDIDTLCVYNAQTEFIETANFVTSPRSRLKVEGTIPYAIENKVIGARDMQLSGMESLKDITYFGGELAIKFTPGFTHRDMNWFDPIPLTNPTIENLDAPDCISFTLRYSTSTSFPSLKNIKLPDLEIAKLENVGGEAVQNEAPSTDRTTQNNFDFLQNVQRLEAKRCNGAILNCCSFEYLRVLSLRLVQPLPADFDTAFPVLHTLRLDLEHTSQVPSLDAPVLHIFNLMVNYDEPSDEEGRLKGLMESLRKYPQLTHLEINTINVALSDPLKDELEAFATSKSLKDPFYRVEQMFTDVFDNLW